MQLEFSLHPRLPGLAWAASIRRDAVTIYHGSHLERGRDWLLDGSWAGNFEDGLPETDVDPFFGFALRATDGGLKIDCPTHLLERLFLLRHGDRLIVSPSVPFVLALGHAEVDPGYPDYMFDFMNINRQPALNCGSIPLADGRRLEFIVNRRVLISKDLEVRPESRNLARTFRSFGEYEEFLMRTLASLRDNAASKGRQAHRYGLRTTISSGYDSVAVSALAAEAGADGASTLISGEDSGDAVAAQLGLKVERVPRDHYLRQPGLPEAEFLATGFHAEDIVLSGAADFFRGHLVAFGIYGDAMWERSDPKAKGPELRMRFGSGCALNEFRWRVGYQMAPLVFAGGQGVTSVESISESKEMAPWRLRENYDRPIPRRIAETRGVSRESFALKKFGLFSVDFGPFSGVDVETILTPESRASFREFMLDAAPQRKLSTRLRRGALYSAYRAERFVGGRLKKLGVLKDPPDSFQPRHQVWPGASSFLFAWACSVMKDRYRAAGICNV